MSDRLISNALDQQNFGPTQAVSCHLVPNNMQDRNASTAAKQDIRRINTSSHFKRCRTQKSISMKLTTTQTYLVHKELEKKYTCILLAEARSESGSFREQPNR